MPTTFRQEGTTTIVQIDGRLDTLSYAAFETEAGALLGNGSRLFIFDCAGLEYVSSAGLRAMLALRKRLHATGLALRLCQLQPGVLEVFEISGFTEIFDIRATLKEALL